MVNFSQSRTSTANIKKVWPAVSIVVNNFNNLRRLEKCLNSLVKMNYLKFEIIVSDCLTKDIERWISDRFPNVKLIHCDIDSGVSRLRNAGLSLTYPESKYVAFIDDDVVVTKDWLQELLTVLESNPKVGGVQPLLLSEDSPAKTDSIGGFVDRIGYACKPSASPSPSKKTWPICYGEALFVVRRDVFKNLPDPEKPFDEDYFIYWEDLDFCWALLISGYQLLLVPNAIAYHKRRRSGGLAKQSQKMIFLNSRNRVTTFIKYYDCKNLLFYFPVLTLLEVAKSVVLARRKPLHSKEILRGIFWNLINFKLVWRKRLVIQKKVRKVGDDCATRCFMPPNMLRAYRDLKLHYGKEPPNGEDCE